MNSLTIEMSPAPGPRHIRLAAVLGSGLLHAALALFLLCPPSPESEHQAHRFITLYLPKPDVRPAATGEPRARLLVRLQPVPRVFEIPAVPGLSALNQLPTAPVPEDPRSEEYTSG